MRHFPVYYWSTSPPKQYRLHRCSWMPTWLNGKSPSMRIAPMLYAGLRKIMQKWAGNYRPDLKLMPGEVIGHFREPNIVLEVWCFFFNFSLFGCLCCYCCCCCWTDVSKLLYVDVYTHRLELRSPLEMLLPVVGSRKYSAERYNEFDLQKLLVIRKPICLFYFYIFAYTFDVLSKIIAKTSIRKHSSNVSFWGLHILKTQCLSLYAFWEVFLYGIR